jgi:hypothetical protein
MLTLTIVGLLNHSFEKSKNQKFSSPKPSRRNISKYIFVVQNTCVFKKITFSLSLKVVDIHFRIKETFYVK